MTSSVNIRCRNIIQSGRSGLIGYRGRYAGYRLVHLDKSYIRKQQCASLLCKESRLSKRTEEKRERAIGVLDMCFSLCTELAQLLFQVSGPTQLQYPPLKISSTLGLGTSAIRYGYVIMLFIRRNLRTEYIEKKRIEFDVKKIRTRKKQENKLRALMAVDRK